MNSNTKPKIIAIVGPTASGKTSLSIEIAQKFHGEVVSADSRQVYRGLDIGTGKVTSEEADGVPHHLIDVAEVNQVYTAADFVRDATTAIEKIRKNDHLPIIAGGTFFYLDALRGRHSLAPAEPDQDLRAKLEEKTTDELLEQLKLLDEKRAEQIDQKNKRRLIRAIEIVSTLGHTPEVTQSESKYDFLSIGLEIEKEILREKFRKRILDWLDRGFVDEVHELIEQGVSKDRLHEIGFEYQLALSYIEQSINEDELTQRFIEKNWQYAKRQMTWLKRDEEIEWFTPENRSAIFRRVDEFLSS